MTKEQKDDLKTIAALLGISRAEAIRRALALGIQRLMRGAK
ncbi:ribbon-helix-helix protein, CopG family [Nocardioides sp.]